MSSIALKILDILKTEFSDQQARKIAEVIDEAISNVKTDEVIATKQYVNEIEKDIKNELTEMKRDISVIKSTMATKDELKDMKFDMLKWIFIIISVNTLVIVSTIITIGKFIVGK